MKLVIDIDEKVLEHIKTQEILLSEIDVVCESIANGNPYEERPKGKWINKHIKEDYTLIGTCSICHERTRIGNFCRMCGADMRGEKNEIG